METVYEHIDSALRCYHGITVTVPETEYLLVNSVRDNLRDSEQRNSLLDQIRTLQEDTGFSAEGLMLDIQALENGDAAAADWRIGEALAEVFLGDNFSCRFYWNEIRDARNPRGNKTGADLVGFIETDGDVLFLFGEVKTSSEIERRPPQVMTNADGIENQLRDLYRNREKRLILISYIQNKANLFPDDHPFKSDWNRAVHAYYASDTGYQLYGVLVRDVDPGESDIFASYNRLKKEILEPIGLRLLALYVPIPKENWLNIINDQ